MCMNGCLAGLSDWRYSSKVEILLLFMCRWGWNFDYPAYHPQPDLYELFV
jgi:hypothetical protein